MFHRSLLALTSCTMMLGCSTKPISYLTTTPRPAEDAYACALRMVNQLGYTVTNTSAAAGFIAGTKQTSGLGTRILTGSEYHDQLTVSVFGDEDGGRRIRVTAGRIDQNSNLFGTSTKSMKPSDSGKNDATTLLGECGSGAVTEQGDGALEAAA